MSQFGGVDKALSLAVERLKRLHEVGEGSGVRVGANLLVDGQNLFKLVLFLAYNIMRQTDNVTRRLFYRRNTDYRLQRVG